MLKQDTVLLLTAAIDPGNVYGMKRVDKSNRLEDYKNSLKLWLTRQDSIKKIVFCENTNSDLSEIQKIINSHKDDKEVELLSFYGQNFDMSKGKGYGEGISIKYSLQHSKFLKECRYFLKATGRLYIKNIEEIINNLSVDCDISSMFTSNLKTINTQLIFFRKEIFINHFIDEYEHVDDSNGMFLENIYAFKVLELLPTKLNWQPSIRPYFIGYSGTDNKKINTVKYSFKYFLKNLLIKDKAINL